MSGKLSLKRRKKKKPDILRFFPKKKPAEDNVVNENIEEVIIQGEKVGKKSNKCVEDNVVNNNIGEVIVEEENIEKQEDKELNEKENKSETPINQITSQEREMSDIMNAYADMQYNSFHSKNKLVVLNDELDNLNEEIRKLDVIIWDICNNVFLWQTGDNQLEEIVARSIAEERIHDIVGKLKADLINECRKKHNLEKETKDKMEKIKRVEAEIYSNSLHLEYLA